MQVLSLMTRILGAFCVLAVPVMAQDGAAAAAAAASLDVKAIGVGIVILGAGLGIGKNRFVGCGEHCSPARSCRCHPDSHDYCWCSDRRCHPLRSHYLYALILVSLRSRLRRLSKWLLQAGLSIDRSMICTGFWGDERHTVSAHPG